MQHAQTRTRELYGIQMLRAIAALAVVTHHGLEQSNGAPGHFSPDWLTTSGASGVDIFFVISGFIMLYVNFRPTGASTRALVFLFGRATRIYPFYWLCCLTMLTASLGGYMTHHHWGARAVAGSLLLVPNDNPLINVAWTLVYEVYFYLIFAVTLIWRSMRISIIGTSTAIFGFMLSSLALPECAAKAFLANPIPLEFCMGLWLAWIFARWNRSEQRWPIGSAFALLGAALLAVAPLAVEHRNTSGIDGFARVLAWGLPSVLIVAAFLRLEPPRAAMSRFLVLLGDSSYALYLTHVFIMIGYAKLLEGSTLGRFDQRWVVPVVVATAVVVAVTAHLLVERPLLARIRHLTGSRRRHLQEA